MIACYCRVSTVRQKADSQVNEITKWLKANGYDQSPDRVVRRQGNGQNVPTS